ncbi:2-oxoglutarate/malate transporter [Streptomyces violarus]|uniref:2-oxoglutarate/malate transporter n=1 Tax=Streptomyces violarus TaxID=67380 RepID=UPI0021BF06BB|nr:2-oxoglutarate/malate transporter [Streptomyces violarus]MCT9139156.1 2-oxoglutarate/malate transporter [Streptomyces violarus]
MLRNQSGTSPAATSFARVSGLAALGFAFLIVVGNVVLVPAGLPRTGAGIGEVDGFFRAHGELVGIGSALTPAAWVLATLFGAGAVRVLWQSERDRGEAWALLGFAGLILQNAVFAVVIAIRLALASTAADGVGAAASLWALHDTLFTLNGTFLALALVGLSLAGMRGGLIRPWHARWGLLSAALLFGSAVLTPLVVDHVGPFGLLGLAGWLMWVVWVVVYGVVLMRPAPISQTPSGP